MAKLLSFLKSLPRVAWEVLLVLVSIVVAVLATRKKNEAEENLKHAEANKTDAVLEEKQREVHVREAEVVAAGEEEKKKDLTPEELAKELNKI